MATDSSRFEGDTAVLPTRTREFHLAKASRWFRQHRFDVVQVGIVGTIFVALVLFYWWSVNTSGSGISIGGTYGDYYNQLADAFLHGHLYLASRPPSALVHLADPYNPALNSVLAAPYHDLILYRDHFYVSWGPTAALVLFIPWRILHIGGVNDSFAIVVFSGVGLMFATALLYWLAHRFAKVVRTWQLALGTFALGLSSVEPYLMRRPAEYEVAISCAYCFLCAGLFGLITGSFGARTRPWRIAFGSLCLGLAILSRFDLVVLLVVPVGIVIRQWFRGDRPRIMDAVRLAIPYLVPVGLFLVVLAIYNAARFGSPTQFGAAFELAGVEQTKNFNYQFTSILPGLYYYLICPIQTTLAFPNFALGPPPFYPWNVANYGQTEQVAGVFTTTPVLALLFAAPFGIRGRKMPRDFTFLVGLLVGAAFLVSLVISWGIPGTTMRYEADFATLLLLPAILCWIVLSHKGRPWFVRVPIRILGALALVLGAAIGAAISITGPYDEMRQFDTAKYVQVGNLADFIPTFVTMLVGHPMIVKDTYQCGNGECGISSPGLSHWTLNDHNGVELDVVAPFGGWQVSMEIFNADPKVHRTAVTNQIGNTIATYYTGVGEHRIYVPLHQGLNRMVFVVPGPDSVSFYALRTSRIAARSAS